jgi:hypothetical protein
MNPALALQLEEVEAVVAPGDAAYVIGVGVGVAIGIGLIAFT